MIILDQPYTSPELADYLVQSRVPVLDTAPARALAAAGRDLNIMDDDAFARSVDEGARLYTPTENSLEWVSRAVSRPDLLAAIAAMKDKVRMRRTLTSLYPDYFFREVAADRLDEVDALALPYPLVLKPAVGFFSVGVYAVHTPDEWHAAVDDIKARRQDWRAGYQAAVVADDRFIIEQYITGDEYAFDVYYDDDGQAVVVNVMRHDFASAADVGDRLYYTSPDIIRANASRFAAFMNQVNAGLNIRNFPVHVELRDDGRCIIPIEFNPLRFAGWCCTDLAWFAYGLRTYQLFLDDQRPNWDEALAGKDGSLYSLVILDKPKDTAPGTRLDFDAVGRVFTEVLHMRTIDDVAAPVWGFVFARTPADNRAELDRILGSDLREFTLPEG